MILSTKVYCIELEITEVARFGSYVGLEVGH